MLECKDNLLIKLKNIKYYFLKDGVVPTDSPLIKVIKNKRIEYLAMHKSSFSLSPRNAIEFNKYIHKKYCKISYQEACQYLKEIRREEVIPQLLTTNAKLE